MTTNDMMASYASINGYTVNAALLELVRSFHNNNMFHSYKDCTINDAIYQFLKIYVG